MPSARVSVDSLLDPSAYLSLSAFPNVSTGPCCRELARGEGEGREGWQTRSHASRRNCFPEWTGNRNRAARARAVDPEVVQCVPSLCSAIFGLFVKSFSACQFSGSTAGWQNIPSSTSNSVGVAGTRASFFVLPELLPRKSFPSHLYPSRRSPAPSPTNRLCFLSPAIVIERRAPSSLPPASLRKLSNFWREYDTSEFSEASGKEHGNAFCPHAPCPRPTSLFGFRSPEYALRA